MFCGVLADWEAIPYICSLRLHTPSAIPIDIPRFWDGTALFISPLYAGDGKIERWSKKLSRE